MKIGILNIEQADSHIIERIQESLSAIFPKTICSLINDTFTTPKEALNKTRNQYSSETILSKIQAYADKKKTLDRILGIVDVDIYVSHLSFVFGQAELPGKAALISLWRLKPEFYGEKPNAELYVERSIKEAVHELGHTLGLRHCRNPFCVMFFSNSIFETDRKKSLFCNKCYVTIETNVNKIGDNIER